MDGESVHFPSNTAADAYNSGGVWKPQRVAQVVLPSSLSHHANPGRDRGIDKVESLRPTEAMHADSTCTTISWLWRAATHADNPSSLVSTSPPNYSCSPGCATKVTNATTAPSDRYDTVQLI
jgi:hypothetical protein